MSQQRDMSGVLFKKDRKEKDSHPDYKGNAMVDGSDYWLSAWIKQGQNGKFMSLSFTEKNPQQGNKPRQQTQNYDFWERSR